MNPDHITEWMLAVGPALVGVAVAVAIGRVFWRALPRARRTVQLAALDAAVARHPSGSKLPGPGKPQASGISDSDDTGTDRAAFDRELAEWLRQDKGL